MKTLFSNGTIYTMEREGETVGAVVTDGDLILACGSREELEKRFAGEITEKVDLQGLTMFPGFVDSHMHLIGYGESLQKLSLANIGSKADLLAAVKGQAESVPAGEWITGEGWDENTWLDPAPPTAEELDRAAPDHPVMLKRVCRHAVAVNSKALGLAGITAHTSDPDGGRVGRNADGKPDGILMDEAQNLIYDKMPEIEDDYVARALETGIRSCWKLGLTGGHTEDLSYYGSCRQVLDAFHSVLEEKGLSFRSHLLIHHKVLEDWARLEPEYRGSGGTMEFGAVKLFADGALGSRTALLSAPYADDPSTSGLAVHSQAELASIVESARARGRAVAAHLIGDLAFERFLDVIERFPPPGGARDRLIHGQILRPELIERAARLPVAVDIQPAFVPSDFPWVIERIGRDKMSSNYAWKSMINAGLRCAGGSDAPIEPADPLLGIHAAVTRKKPGGEEVYMPEQRLSMFEAVSLYTSGSAYAACQENRRGMIKPGFLADFTVLDRDLFEVAEGEILETRPAMTVVGSRIVYSSDSKETAIV